jgi:uncharacterized protein YaaW (UPF0174 family)
MAVYREDSDLTFLKKCSNEDLELLVSILTIDPNDNTSRFTETLTSDTSYKRYYPNHQLYWKSIAAELQTFCANSGMTLLRQGKGVCYREILIDVCDKTKINLNEPPSFFIEKIENVLLNSLLKQSLENMEQHELKKLAAELGHINLHLPPAVLMLSIQKSIMSNPLIWNSLIFSMLGNLGFKIGNIMATMFTIIPRLHPILAALTGPIGLAISNLWLLSDIAGPAYRVTIPACLYVAVLRKKHNDSNIIDQLLRNGGNIKKFMGKSF